MQIAEHTISVETTAADLAAFNRYMWRRTTPSLVGTILWFFIGLACMGLLSVFRDNPVPVLLVGTALGFYALLVLRARRIWFSQRAMFGNRTYTLGADFLQVDGPGFASRIEWGCFRSIEETPAHIFIVWDRLYGYIVPKRAFSTEQACADFVADLKTKIRCALRSPMPQAN